jgi:hypothetical protein
MHSRRKRYAYGEQSQRQQDDPPQSIAINKGRGKWPDETKQSNVDGDRARDGGAAPAKFVLQRNHQNGRGRADTGRDQKNKEGHACDDPGVMQFRGAIRVARQAGPPFVESIKMSTWRDEMKFVFAASALNQSLP